MFRHCGVFALPFNYARHHGSTLQGFYFRCFLLCLSARIPFDGADSRAFAFSDSLGKRNTSLVCSDDRPWIVRCRPTMSLYIGHVCFVHSHRALSPCLPNNTSLPLMLLIDICLSSALPSLTALTRTASPRCLPSRHASPSSAKICGSMHATMHSSQDS